MTATIDQSRTKHRLPMSSSQVTNRDVVVKFKYNGQEITAYEGDTIASALAAHGITTFSRSFKYHRRRGLMCVSGNCPNCLVQVGNEPSVRSCTCEVEDGMDVESQNAWPNLDVDVMQLTQLADRFLPAGFYYKAFIRPQAMWPLYERVLRTAAGLGKVNEDAEPDYFDKVYKQAEVAVIGGGPAGLNAALAAAEAGAQVTLLEEQATLGGHLRHTLAEIDGKPAYAYAGELAAKAEAHPNIDMMPNTNVFGHYDHHWLGAVQGNRLIKLRAKTVINAAGAVEIPALFENNDLTGIMLSSGAQRLMNLWGVVPGNTAVVVSANRRGLQTTLEMARAGVHLARVVEQRAIPDTDLITALMAEGITVETDLHVVKAVGSDGELDAVQLSDGSETPCDLLVLSTGLMPNYGLLYQAGVRYRWDESLASFVPGDLPQNVFAAGEVNASHDLDLVEAEGKLAGLSAASAAGYPVDGLDALQAQVDEARAIRQPWSQYMLADEAGKKDFVCLCEDVTRKDIAHSVEEGYNSMELLKRYSTVSMGPCQGRMCNLHAMHLCAHYTGQTVEETGTTTSRPPARPVSLGALGGRLMEPVRFSAMHEWHVQHGAQMMNAGLWKRPEHYGDPIAEVRAVRQRVGIIDVSTLGKFHLQGADVPLLLERLYTNRWRKLGIGRVRYGVMTNDEGVVMDDGVTARLAEDHYYMTATSGGAGRLYEWIEWWLQSGMNYDVHLLDATEDRAAINVAGPCSRELLEQLTEDVDLGNDAFPYMHARQATIAGVPSLLMRIGFTGELSYELHVPTGYAQHVWNALVDAGAQYNIRSFGVEAQRILRLEKGHIIVGQDTDGLTNPIEANMGWAVKLEKEDFFGKPVLARAIENGPRNLLVGFEMPDGTLPEEANQIVRPGDGPIGLEIIGRVTSVRRSPTLGRVIGLCWLPVEMTEPGTEFSVRVRSELKRGRVTELPFYDKPGRKLRS